MSMPSYLPRRDYDRIKAAFRDLVDAAGGVARAATIVRIDAPRLSRYGRPVDEQSCFAPVDVVADLEAQVGEPVVTRELADLGGFLVIPKLPAKGDPDWLRKAASVLKESGETVAAIGQAIRDGGVSREEAEDIRREAREAMQALAEVCEHADRLLNGPRPVPHAVRAMGE